MRRLLEQDDLLAVLQRTRGCNQPRQAAADDGDIRLDGLFDQDAAVGAGLRKVGFAEPRVRQSILDRRLEPEARYRGTRYGIDVKRLVPDDELGNPRQSGVRDHRSLMLLDHFDAGDSASHKAHLHHDVAHASRTRPGRHDRVALDACTRIRALLGCGCASCEPQSGNRSQRRRSSQEATARHDRRFFFSSNHVLPP